MQRNARVPNTDKISRSGQTTMRIFINKLIKAKDKPYPFFELPQYAQIYMKREDSTSIETYLKGMRNAVEDMKEKIGDNTRLKSYVDEILENLQKEISKDNDCQEKEEESTTQKAEEALDIQQRATYEALAKQRAAYETYAKAQAEALAVQEEAEALLLLLESSSVDNKRKGAPVPVTANQKSKNSPKRPKLGSADTQSLLAKNPNALHRPKPTQDGKELNQVSTSTMKRTI